jgi:hypothetical protein
MDPITTAIEAALIYDLSKSTIKNSYNGLKNAIKHKFGSESDLIDAIDKLEQKPDSKGRKVMLQEEVEIAQVNDDPEIVQLAQDLLNKIKEQPEGQQVINQTQTNTVIGVTVGGNLEFKPVQQERSQ